MKRRSNVFESLKSWCACKVFPFHYYNWRWLIMEFINDHSFGVCFLQKEKGTWPATPVLSAAFPSVATAPHLAKEDPALLVSAGPLTLTGCLVEGHCWVLGVGFRLGIWSIKLDWGAFLFLPFPQSRFVHLKSGENNTYFLGLADQLNEITHRKCLAQCLASWRNSVNNGFKNSKSKIRKDSPGFPSELERGLPFL